MTTTTTHVLQTTDWSHKQVDRYKQPQANYREYRQEAIRRVLKCLRRRPHHTEVLRRKTVVHETHPKLVPGSQEREVYVATTSGLVCQELAALAPDSKKKELLEPALLHEKLSVTPAVKADSLGHTL